ncbi:MAG: hypothetical protein HY321_04035 [Armatimonadetes bacterium]|nr:hypothetical protein [Armatimonadota bacterium]
MGSTPGVWVLLHATCETLGTIACALDAAGIRPRQIRSFAGQPVPEGVGDAAGPVVMGGPMGFYECRAAPSHHRGGSLRAMGGAGGA